MKSSEFESINGLYNREVVYLKNDTYKLVIEVSGIPIGGASRDIGTVSIIASPYDIKEEYEYFGNSIKNTGTHLKNALNRQEKGWWAGVLAEMTRQFLTMIEKIKAFNERNVPIIESVSFTEDEYSKSIKWTVKGQSLSFKRHWNEYNITYEVFEEDELEYLPLNTATGIIKHWEMMYDQVKNHPSIRLILLFDEKGEI